MTTIHPYYHKLLSALLERLVSPHIDEQTWRERLAHHKSVVEVKERIWLRQSQEFVTQCQPYLTQIELMLNLTQAPLKHLMSYRGEDEREDYTRLTQYRGALLDERERIDAVLDHIASATPHGANDDVEIMHAAHPDM